MKYIARLLFVMMLPLHAIAEDKHDSYICIADKSTGFSQSKEEWTVTTFDVDNGKYVLKKLDNNNWSWTRVGKSYGFNECVEEEYRIVCDSILFGEVIFMKSTLRYQHYYRGGYLLLRDIPFSSDTPLIEIGKCSPL